MNKNYTILVVEDELPLQAAIKLKLENNSLDVVTARTAKQAKEYLEMMPEINVIWLDHYLLGQQDGLTFVAEIKEANSPYKNIPIFVVSNSVDETKMNSYLSMGVKRYYTKTECSLMSIIEDIRAHLDQGEN